MFFENYILNIQVLFLSTSLIIILFVLLKAKIENRVTKKKTLIVTFLVNFYEVILAYNKLKIIAKFLDL